jgi:REP element-mobilizing transposase RayT
MFGIKIYEFSGNSNHIHILLRGKQRIDLQNFFRTLTGVIARKITNAQRGRKFGSFWMYLLYSRVVNWGRDFLGTKKYVIQNKLEAVGLVEFKPRPKKKNFNTT